MAEFRFTRPPEIAASGELPSPPGVVQQILRLVNDDHSTADDLAHVMEIDPVLTAKLLRTVNSSMYGLSRRIHSVSHGAALIGFRAVRSLALGVSVSDSLPEGGLCEQFEIASYWRRSLMSAVVARGVASHVQKSLAEDAFVAGLLGNLGKLVLARVLPQKYGPLLDHAPWPTAYDEMAALGYTSYSITAALLEQWQLPRSMCMAVGFGHTPESLPPGLSPEDRTLVAICAATERAVDELMLDVGSADLETISKAAVLDLGINAYAVEAALREARDHIGDSEHLIAENLPGGISPSSLVDQARRLLDRADHGLALSS